MLNLRQISYREPPTPMMMPVFLGNRQRNPSVTDVIILGPHLYLVAHRYASKLYITETDPVNHRHRNLFTETTIYRGHAHYVESMEMYQNKVYVIAYSEYLLVYRYETDPSPRLIYEKTIQVGPPSVRYHGIKVHQNHIYLTPSVGEATEYPTEIVRFNPMTEQIDRLGSPDIHSNYRIKDIVFLEDDTLLLIVNYKISKRMTQRGAVFNGFFGLYRMPRGTDEIRLLDRVEYEHVHFDRGVYDSFQDIFYVTGGNKEGGYLWRGRVDKETFKLVMMEPIQVADFPHGIRVEREAETEAKTDAKTKIAYTSYGTDSMYYGYLE